MRIHIGTSGWSYPHWRGPFYPPGLPQSRWLGCYARHFETVELNRSFYRLPERRVFADWREQTPEGFRFSVKASRLITHMKKLLDPDRTLPPLLDAVAGLEEKAGPLLFQLPPRWHRNEGRLAAFLDALPAGIAAAFELRDPSWHTDRVREILARHGAAFCIFDLGGFRSPRAVTADFAYLRMHGPGAPYCGRYGREGLEPWARWLRSLSVADAYVYFDNDQAGYAVQDALELRALLGIPGPCRA